MLKKTFGILLSLILVAAPARGEVVPAISGSRFDVEPTTGTASMSIPIEVPPGRGGIQPSVAISYSSSVKNGIAGIGWSVETGSVIRNTKRGVPQYDATDEFALNQGGSEELISIGGGLYVPKLESGAFLKIEKGTNDWTVTDKKGTRYFFGQASQSRQFAAGQESNTFRWYLDRVEDVHANAMTVEYLRDGEQLYPQKIKYNFEVAGPTVHGNEVEFIYETRPDTIDSYISGFRVVTTKRLKEVKVFAAGVLQRRYELTYSQSAATGRSLLTRVRQYGSDDITSVPDVIYSYHDSGTKGFQHDTGWTIPSIMQFSAHRNNFDVDLGVRVADLNGDTFPDLIKSAVYCSGGDNVVYLNNKQNGWTLNASWALPGTMPLVEICPDYWSKDNGIRLADANADGRVDLSQYFHVEGSGTTQGTYVRQSNAWQLDTNWNMPPYAPSSSFQTDVYYTIKYNQGPAAGSHEFMGTLLADINGDGRADYVRAKTGYGDSHWSFINSGTGGWQYDSSWNTPSGVNFASGWIPVDLNADGLLDIFHSDGSSVTVYLNNGNNWTNVTATTQWAQLGGIPGDINTTNGSVQFADINADGLEDLIVARGSFASGSRVLINAGDRFIRDDAWVFSEGSFINSGTRLADVNADGLVDFMVYDHFTPAKVYLNQGGQPTDVLKEIDNSTGGTTELTYGRGSGDNLPFVLPVVTAVTTNDAITQDSFTTQYLYEEGAWDAGDREFRGFGTVTITDPEGNYTETRYYQDDEKKGRIYDQRAYTSAGVTGVYTWNVHAWDVEDLGNGSKFVFLSRKSESLYENNTPQRRALQDYFYEEATQLGNLTKVIDLGEIDPDTWLDIGTDARTIETQYVNNTSGGNYIVGLPRQTTVKDYQAVETRKSWFWYDNHPNLTDPPAAGLLSKKEDWNNQPQGHADNPVTLYSYDTSGNLLTTTDARGKTTSIAYDPTYRLFPLTTTNALNHTVISEYYGVNGVQLDDGNGLKGLWGQLKSTTDPNNQAGKRSYDVFGRTVKVISPLDTVALPTSEKVYTYAANHFRVNTKQRIESGQAAVIEAMEFFDGLGRSLQKKSPTEAAGVYVVSNQTEYNSRGLPQHQHLPFFSTDPFTSVTAINPSNPKNQTEYDGLGRVMTVTNADQSYVSFKYVGFMTQVINENGHMQRSHNDARGRLVKKEEYRGADGRGAPTYTATSGPVDSHYTQYATTLYEYDSEGNLVKTTDAHNNLVTIQYDKLGRKVQMNDPDMGTWTYEYDLNGNLVRQTDAKNQQINFTYDDLNRLTNKTDGADLDVTYTYDEVTLPNTKGRLTRATYTAGPSATNDTRFFYDQMGREEQSRKVIDTNAYDVKRNYDALNRLTDVEYPDGKKVYYKYNAAGQIEAVADDPSLFPGGGASLKKEIKDDDVMLVKKVLDTVGNALDFLLGVREAHAQSANFTVNLEAEDMPTKTTGGPTTYGWNIWSNGYVEEAVTFPVTGDYKFEIIARGDYAGGAWPNMQLRINQSSVQNFTVASSSWGTYIVTVNVTAGTKNVAIAFTNDYYVPPADRNLKVDKTIISRPASGAYLQPNDSQGIVSMEAENYDGVYSIDTQSWDIVSQAGESGNGSVQALPNWGNNNDTDYINLSPRMHFYVNFAKTGTHYIWARGIGASGNDDSFHAGLDSQPVPGAESITSFNTSWTWSKTTASAAPATVNVASVGVHAVDIWMREDGMLIDKIVITADANYTPAGTGPAETVREGQAPPAAPVLNAAVPGDQEVALSWNSVAEADGYKVKYGTSSGNYTVTIPNILTTSHTVTGLTNDVEYFFAVVAYNVNGDSADSNEQSATPQGPPTTPDPPTLQVPSPGDGQVGLEWTPSAGATNYKIYYGTTPGGGAGGTDFTQDPDCAGAWKLDEASGSVIDACGSSDGTVSGSVAQGTTGQFDEAVEFLGTGGGGNNAHINLGSDVSLDNLAERTITAWIRPDNLGDGSQGRILSKNYQDGWEFRLSASNKLLFSQAFSGGVVRWETTNSVITLDTWQHLAVTYEGGTSGVPVFYVNGTLAASQRITSAPFGTQDNDSSYDLKMGIASTTGEFDGKMDEVAVFKRILTPAEINAIKDDGLSGGTGSGYPNMISVGNVTQYTVTGLTNETAYYFVVTAENAAGESGYSNERSAIPTLVMNLYVADVDYNAFGAITRIEYGNGAVTTYTYHPLNARLLRIFTEDASQAVLQDLNYTYDKAGNILTVADNANTADQSFVYDELARLVQATGQVYGTKTYVYDEIGNIMQKDGLSYTYGEGTAGPHAVTSLHNGAQLAESFTYDANGNMVQRVKGTETTDYVYDVENRLVEVVKDTETAAVYAYDGDGGRVKKTVASSSFGSNTSTCFVGGTEVLMADGSSKKIEDLKIGDRVLSYDEGKMENVPASVLVAFEHDATEYLVINRSLQVTAAHPFYSQGQWVEAGKLAAGDLLLTRDGREITVESVEKVVLESPERVYNIEVSATNHGGSAAPFGGDLSHNYYVASQGEFVLVHNKLSFGGGTSSLTGGATTRYVGSLYEEDDNRSSKFIFLGGTRIAAVTNGQVLYYHADHLGGTNVLTDSEGVKKELIEYEPFGSESKHEKYGSSHEVAWYYFTGKPLDDETGLMYFGARYYDPRLGRFITADSIVQDPTNPQTLNRYSYTSNNPVNRTDFSGHSWFSKFIKKWAGLFGFTGGLVKGIITGDWSTLQNLTTSFVTSFVFSGGNPIAVLASTVATSILDTPPGKQFSGFLSNEVFDDAFGMSPRVASVFGSITSHAIVASAVYLTLTPETYSGPDYRDSKTDRSEIEKYGLDKGKGNGGRGANKMAEGGGKGKWLKQGRIASQNGWEDVPFVRAATKALNINHTAVVIPTSSGFFDSALDNSLINPLKSGDLWLAPWTGTCQQVCFTTLVEEAGMSGWQAFNAVGQSAGWTYYTTSAIYGVRADFGGVGLVVGAINKRER